MQHLRIWPAFNNFNTSTFFSQVVDTEGVVEEDEEDSGVDSEEVSGVDRDIRLLKGRSLEWGYLYL